VGFEVTIGAGGGAAGADAVGPGEAPAGIFRSRLGGS
jgi:hypothetical protein